MIWKIYVVQLQNEDFCKQDKNVCIWEVQVVDWKYDEDVFVYVEKKDNVDCWRMEECGM